MDISEKKDGSVRKEWFYLETDVSRAEVQKTAPQRCKRGEVKKPAPQRCEEPARDTNREENTETVNALQKQRKDPEQVRYLVERDPQGVRRREEPGLLHPAGQPAAG